MKTKSGPIFEKLSIAVVSVYRAWDAFYVRARELVNAVDDLGRYVVDGVVLDR